MGVFFSCCVSSKSDDVVSSSKFEGDKKWARIAAAGRETGSSHWGKQIVKLDIIHPRLFMGSRLSAQEVIDKGRLKDQNENIYDAKQFHLVCVASESTCEYCSISDRYKNYEMQDREFQDDGFLETAVKTADHIHKKLSKGKHVIVHCHAGRNRSALAVLVYCARHTNMSYEEALHQIRLLNSSRFPMQSTLQNNQFTSSVRNNWDKIRK